MSEQPAPHVAEIRELLMDDAPERRQEGLVRARALGDCADVLRGCEIRAEGRVAVPFGEPSAELLALLW